MSALVRIVDHERVDGDPNVVDGEPEVGLLCKPGAPIGPQLVLAVYFAGGFLQAVRDVRRLEHDVVNAVAKKPVKSWEFQAACHSSANLRTNSASICLKVGADGEPSGRKSTWRLG